MLVFDGDWLRVIPHVTDVISVVDAVTFRDRETGFALGVEVAVAD
jgi:hypothetical protein